MDGWEHALRNDMQMWLQIVKRGVVSSIYGIFAWGEDGWGYMYTQSSADQDF